ncbi:hypothetical protein [Cysteiniphilum litorale]|uniref:hypothetical protein n=1 Tax=Cysteiniphilum litorale TaxID=2056700 RepID=UPI003F881CD1
MNEPASNKKILYWCDLKKDDQDKLCHEYIRVSSYSVNYMNHYARLMINWLYALSIAGIGFCLIYKSSSTSSIILFSVSLLLAILWATLEYIRSTLLSKKQLCAFVELINLKCSVPAFSKKLSENKYWYHIILVVAIIGYLVLFLAFILSFSFCNIK